MIRSRPSTDEYRAGYERIFCPTASETVRDLVEEGRRIGAAPWSPSKDIQDRVIALLRIAGVTRVETMRETLKRRQARD